MNTTKNNLRPFDENQLSQEKNKETNHSKSKAMRLMEKRPGALEAFMQYRNQLLENGPLSKRERTLIMLASTVALKACSCIAVQSENARNEGASEEEIVQTMLIAGIVSGNTTLSTAYSSYYGNNH